MNNPHIKFADDRRAGPAPLEWHAVPSALKDGMHVMRAQIPLGWLVKMGDSLIFVEDRNHAWV